MGHDPCYIAVIYKGPKRYHGNRCKTLTLPIGITAYTDIKFEVTFSSPKFLAAIPARFVGAMVEQAQFDFANDEQWDKYRAWLEQRTKVVDGVKVVTEDEPGVDLEEVLNVTPPTTDEVQKEIDAAEALKDYRLTEPPLEAVTAQSGVVHVTEPEPEPKHPQLQKLPSRRPAPQAKGS